MRFIMWSISIILLHFELFPKTVKTIVTTEEYYSSDFLFLPCAATVKPSPASPRPRSAKSLCRSPVAGRFSLFDVLVVCSDA